MSRENTKELPWDVIAEEILPKLHPKTLAVCRCVSKLWNSYISGPNFVRQLNPVFCCYPNDGRGPRELYFFLRRGRWFSQLAIWAVAALAAAIAIGVVRRRRASAGPADERQTDPEGRTATRIVFEFPKTGTATKITSLPLPAWRQRLVELGVGVRGITAN